MKTKDNVDDQIRQRLHCLNGRLTNVIENAIFLNKKVSGLSDNLKFIIKNEKSKLFYENDMLKLIDLTEKVLIKLERTFNVVGVEEIAENWETSKEFETIKNVIKHKSLAPSRQLVINTIETFLKNNKNETTNHNNRQKNRES